MYQQIRKLTYVTVNTYSAYGVPYDEGQDDVNWAPDEPSNYCCYWAVLGQYYGVINGPRISIGYPYRYYNEWWATKLHQFICNNPRYSQKSPISEC